MEESTPIEKLDAVLNFLNTDHEYQHKVIGVQQGLSIKSDVPTIHKVLDKLVKDGYAEMINMPIDPPINLGNGFFKSSEFLYTITFEGQVFIQKGGYHQQEADSILHRASHETHERLRRRNEKLLSRGTIWLAILTGALVLTEILVHWNELRHLFSCN